MARWLQNDCEFRWRRVGDSNKSHKSSSQDEMNFDLLPNEQPALKLTKIPEDCDTGKRCVSVLPTKCQAKHWKNSHNNNNNSEQFHSTGSCVCVSMCVVGGSSRWLARRWQDARCARSPFLPSGFNFKSVRSTVRSLSNRTKLTVRSRLIKVAEANSSGERASLESHDFLLYGGSGNGDDDDGHSNRCDWHKPHLTWKLDFP